MDLWKCIHCDIPCYVTTKSGNTAFVPGFCINEANTKVDWKHQSRSAEIHYQEVLK